MARSGDQLTSDLAALRIDRDERPRRGILRPLVALGSTGVTVALVALVGYPYLSSRVFKTEVETTEIALVSPAQGSIRLTATGYVVPQTTAKVAAKTIGRVARLAVKEGDVVKPGDVIAYLDDSTARMAVQTARARVATARARAQIARAELAQTTLQLRRERILAARGVTPRATVEDLDAKRRALKDGAQAADTEVAAAVTDVEAAEVNLRDMTVTAPIGGTVIEKLADVGELVGPQAGTLVSLADFSSLAVEIDVPEAKLSLVRVGGPSEIVLDAFPGKRYRGATLEIGSKVDRAKATVKVKVRFVDPPARALPDMAARVSFLDRELEASAMKEPPRLVVPETALADRRGAKVVYVIDPTTERLSLTNVQLGPKLGSGYVLDTDLAPGTKVVANPAPDLRDGQVVKERKD